MYPGPRGERFPPDTFTAVGAGIVPADAFAEHHTPHEGTNATRVAMLAVTALTCDGGVDDDGHLPMNVSFPVRPGRLACDDIFLLDTASFTPGQTGTVVGAIRGCDGGAPAPSRVELRAGMMCEASLATFRALPLVAVANTTRATREGADGVAVRAEFTFESVPPGVYSLGYASEAALVTEWRLAGIDDVVTYGSVGICEGGESHGLACIAGESACPGGACAATSWMFHQPVLWNGRYLDLCVPPDLGPGRMWFVLDWSEGSVGCGSSDACCPSPEDLDLGVRFLVPDAAGVASVADAAACSVDTLRHRRECAGAKHLGDRALLPRSYPVDADGNGAADGSVAASELPACRCDAFVAGAWDTDLAVCAPNAVSDSQVGFEITELGFGHCSDWKYLPEGKYPPFLSAGHRLQRDDPLQECAARCFAQGSGYSDTAFWVRSSDRRCACAKGGCGVRKRGAEYMSYSMARTYSELGLACRPPAAASGACPSGHYWCRNGAAIAALPFDVASGSSRAGVRSTREIVEVTDVLPTTYTFYAKVADRAFAAAARDGTAPPRLELSGATLSVYDARGQVGPTYTLPPVELKSYDLLFNGDNGVAEIERELAARTSGDGCGAGAGGCGVPSDAAAPAYELLEEHRECGADHVRLLAGVSNWKHNDREQRAAECALACLLAAPAEGGGFAASCAFFTVDKLVKLLQNT